MPKIFNRVLTAKNQGLPEDRQANARENIGVYSKDEIDQLIGEFGGFKIAPGDAEGHPDVSDKNPKIIYLVKVDDAPDPDLYREWIWATDEETGVYDWVCIGDTSADLSDMARKSEMSVTESGDRTTVQLADGISATVLNEHQDISGKADKATTLGGYGITDAHITDNVITLGDATVDMGLYASAEGLAGEVSRATAKEAELAGAIAGEASRAMAEETALGETISGEITRATDAEATLNNKIDAETTRAQGTETSLGARITAEATRAEGAETTLNNKIDAETSRAESVEALKANKATTLSGYGITDAKIENTASNTVVTLGSNTLTVGMSDGRVNTIDSHTLFAERANNDATGREIAPNLVPVASNQGGQVLMATASNTAEWSNDATSQFTVYEPIDTVNIGNREYRIVQIDGKWWMAENLDFQWDGLSVPTEDAQHVDTAQAMYYNYDETTYGWDGRRSGLLYNWYAVNYLEENKATLCPGWHVATHAEMEALSTYAGGFRAAPAKLKAASWGGTDDYGFSAVPTGYFATGFVNGDAAAYFWTATEYSSSDAHEWELSSLFNWESDHKYGQCSVRLVKDAD